MITAGRRSKPLFSLLILVSQVDFPINHFWEVNLFWNVTKAGMIRADSTISTSMHDLLWFYCQLPPQDSRREGDDL